MALLFPFPACFRLGALQTSIFESDLFCRLQMPSVWSRSIILLFGKEFLVYLSIMKFNNSEKEDSERHVEKAERGWYPAFSPINTILMSFQKKFFSIF